MRLFEGCSECPWVISGSMMSPIVCADFQKNMPAGPVEISKRAFVSELRSVGEAVGLNVTCKRESSDKAVLDVYRRLAKVVHPDKATGNLVYQQQLNDAKQRWEDARRAARDSKCSCSTSSTECVRATLRQRGLGQSARDCFERIFD